MTWKRIFAATLTQDWLFTMPVEGEWFRVKQTFSSIPPWGYWGYIGQAGGTLSPNPDLASVRRLYPLETSQNLQIITPPFLLGDRAIAIKGFSKRKFLALGFSAFTTIDVWETLEEDLSPVEPTTEYKEILSSLDEIKKNTQKNTPINPTFL